jgi:hypothetical protein
MTASTGGRNHARPTQRKNVVLLIQQIEDGVNESDFEFEEKYLQA